MGRGQLGWVALLVTLSACNDTVTEPAVSCGSYLDDAPEAFGITVENGGDQPIYLTNAGCSGAIGFRILGGSGAVTEVPRDPCDFTCGELTVQSPVCAADCAAPRVVRVEPGGSYALSWTRRVQVQDQMPARCHFEPALATDRCDQLFRAPDGDYGLEVDVYDAVGCGADPCETCTPDAAGSCELPFGASVEGQARIAQATFSLPADGALISVE